MGTFWHEDNYAREYFGMSNVCYVKIRSRLQNDPLGPLV